MQGQLMSRPFARVIALAPSGLRDPRLVVASCRAGALGVLNGTVGIDATIDAVHRVTHFTDRPFGVRLRGEDLGTSVVLEGLPTQTVAVIATESQCGDWKGALEKIRRSGRRALAEVTSRESARAAVAAGADGLIVAGQGAGGLVGDESAFVLLQGVLDRECQTPVWVRGVAGPRGAAACAAAGAAGVVLDGALLLARESPLEESVRQVIARWDGSETVVLRNDGDRSYRVYAAPGSGVPRRELGWGPHQLWPVGQDAAQAATLARRYVTAGGIVQAFARALEEPIEPLDALGENSPLARSHGTRYPIVQGPMTRVSDTVAFAEAVADGGGLPFLALALLREARVRPLLEQARERLRGRAWGVGVLGFVPPELRREQIAAIRAVRPPFALIAGGRTDQARDLEQDGVATYLHVPSPGLLRHFLKDGARRFVLEGRECGGHVGPRDSLLLWEQAIGRILEALDGGVPAEEVHVLFAGGIHDARSGAMVAAIASPLAQRGVRIGVLLGTAYLFTGEAVATGAIVPGFQAEALRCQRTVLLETGPGHEVRVSPTAFSETFERERQRLLAEGRPADAVREALERLNAGRLRAAAKGVDRTNGAGSPLVALGPEEQQSHGLYMLGQIAALRDRVTTIAELHEEVSAGSAKWLARGRIEAPDLRPTSQPSDIAIVGMAALFPGAKDVRTFWENTLQGHDAIAEVPVGRWDWRHYFDPDPKAPDKITSKWGGFVPEVPFDPLAYGMPPSSLPSIEPMHLLTLEVVRAALDDAGYRERHFPRERTAVVLGAGGGAAQLAMGYAFRSYLPLLDTVIPGAGTEALAKCGDLLPAWTEDSFPGILLNVAAGRVANRFDLGGANYTVDAACGSSLAAAHLAVRELESGAADMAILAGADTVQNPFTYLAFSKTHAFSARGRCRPFDAGADGIVIGEGVAALVLKRLADAERDGDRIYAVIKGLGASSDGRAKGLTAPRPEGQILALRRAYEKAGIAPATVGYVEAHGTGTAAGDAAEVGALTEVFAAAGAARGACAVGSVKSLIGHTKCAAGLAGLINASLALHHRILPPTIGVEALNPEAGWEKSPFYVNTQARPWLQSGVGHPCRAAVSAFGFGGTNFHAVLEAYEGDPAGSLPPVRDWPAELLVWRTSDRSELVETLERLGAALERGSQPKLRDLARTINAVSSEGIGGSRGSAPRLPTLQEGPLTLAIVAEDLEDLRRTLRKARAAIAEGQSRVEDPSGLFFSDRPTWPDARLAFVFPGQGAQYPGMLADLAIAFPEVREAFETFDAALRVRGRQPVGPRVFPPPAWSDGARTEQTAALRATTVAQPAVGAACVGLLRLLDSLGVEPHLLAGHSYGELVALHAAGALTVEGLAELSDARGRFMLAAAGREPGSMAAIAAGPEAAANVLDGIEGAAIVNWNGPGQTVISGSTAAVTTAVDRARALGFRAQILPVACAFHSPLVGGAREPLAALAATLAPVSPRRPVYSNTTATRYPADPTRIPAQLGDHLARPVRFSEMIATMYDEGARIFLEVGPGATLTPLIRSILGERSALVLSCDRPGQPGLTGLLLALGRLAVAGVPLRLERLTAGRSTRRLDLGRLDQVTAEPALPPSAWLVDGARARPAYGPEPITFGAGPPLPLPSASPQFAARVSSNGQANEPINPPAAGPGSRGTDLVLAAFQKNMQTFLELQRSTMLAYLSGRAVGVDSKPQPDEMESASGHGAASDRPAAPPGNATRPKNASTNGSNGHHATNGHAPKPEATVDRNQVSARLLAIVGERTGYPAEMLGLDLDLEADLGIDSIKRAEVLGTLRDALPGLDGSSDSETMDTLSRARTLGAIVDRVTALLGSPARGVGRGLPRPTSPSGSLPEDPEFVVGLGRLRPTRQAGDRVWRLLLEAVEAPFPDGTRSLAPGGVVLVTEDGRGVARALAAELKYQGHLVVRVRHGLDYGEGDAEEADLTSPEAVASLLGRVRRRGLVTGLVHALPLQVAGETELDTQAWSARMGPEVRGLFLLAKAAAGDLERAAQCGGACLLAATAMGGTFAAVRHTAAGFFAGQGAVAGLIKTMAREWPAIRTRVVDLDPAEESEVLAATLVREIMSKDERVEVGHARGRRLVLATIGAPLIDRPEGVSLVSAGEPLLVTGGARGITAAVVADLARRWRPTLLLLGTSPLPSQEEDAATLGCESPADLKAILHDRLREAGRPAGLADIERAYLALRREREIRENLAHMRAAGTTVHYARADVRDADALGRVLTDWRRRFGDPVGLIHGAGVIQDKLLRDKTPASFDRVLETKVHGALNLARLLRPEPLRFAAFFSSVAGRYGNIGQGDYAAANEALNKLAIWLDRRWTCRVVSLAWGPWSGVGMVSDLERHLGRRGLGMIPPEVGCARLVEELTFGRKGDVEVVVAGDLGSLEEPAQVARSRCATRAVG
jgi:acyl transferase domain-containing protein/NAD(P)H-dependent flavin oxidoreductase YrpB (nitropropane dioxygenase family)